MTNKMLYGVVKRTGRRVLLASPRVLGVGLGVFLLGLFLCGNARIVAAIAS
jgi:hypothetical protein